MGLSPGTRLGAYEVLALIGSGGMGEVYKARDTRLDRAVAIKVLPPHLAADRDRYQRFEREARAVASLDHPHIGALYDVGQDDGVHFLVMQHLEGETLAARLAKGPLPLDQVLRYAVEIAGALDHAHHRGIVHRDLKPGNIVLTKSGAKLLDFGLAKWRAGGVGSLAQASSAQATVPGSVTEQGMMVGTLHYMAPEQLEGKDVDARTDLFAFGVVVYEMVTGTKAFDGNSPATVIAAILKTEPAPLTTQQPLTPPALAHVVRTCLAKDPEERWQSAADVKRELEWISEAGAEASIVVAPRSSRSRRDVVTAAIVGLLAGSLIGGAIWSRTHTTTTLSGQITRTVVTLPSGASLALDTSTSIALSPDGTHLAYAAQRNGTSQLCVRALDEEDGKPIPGTEGGYGPFFSPDGRWVGFAAKGKLKKVAVSGSALQTLCDVGQRLYGASWGPDDTIVFTPNNATGLFTVAASGGTPRILTTPDRGKHEKSHRFPHFLPGGRAILFTFASADITSFDEARIGVLSLDTGQIRWLTASGTSPSFAPTGHLIYARGASLVAAPFDRDRLEITGSPTTILDGVLANSSYGSAEFTIAGSGSIAYVRGNVIPSQSRVIWVDRHGRSQRLLGVGRTFTLLSLTPDARRLALTATGVNEQVWLYDFAHGTLRQLTFGWDNYSLGWTPDGERIVIASDRNGPYNYFWQRAESAEPAERLTESPNQQQTGPVRISWSPDGKILVFTASRATTRDDIWSLTLAPERTLRPLIQTPFDEGAPSISRDGRWLAYVSDESGRNEVYVQPFPTLDRKWKISTDGGFNPVWARDGRELFYVNGHTLMAVPIARAATFDSGTPRALFERPYEFYAYDVAPDGRFIMTEPDQPDVAPTPITLVQNWFEELKARVPTK